VPIDTIFRPSDQVDVTDWAARQWQGATTANTTYNITGNYVWAILQNADKDRELITASSLQLDLNPVHAEGLYGKHEYVVLKVSIWALQSPRLHPLQWLST
jgi:hypothetical protein